VKERRRSNSKTQKRKREAGNGDIIPILIDVNLDISTSGPERTPPSEAVKL
jgi:hypothetical protein